MEAKLTIRSRCGPHARVRTREAAQASIGALAWPPLRQACVACQLTRVSLFSQKPDGLLWGLGSPSTWWDDITDSEPAARPLAARSHVETQRMERGILDTLTGTARTLGRADTNQLAEAKRRPATPVRGTLQLQATDAGPFFMVAAGTWKEVRELCLMGGGDLASILSAEEAKQAAAACPHLRCYIGLTRNRRGEPFFWTDGSPVEYKAWDDNQPQPSETVTVWTDGAGGNWHDWGEGADVFPGVCKKSERTLEKKCNTISNCEECLKARDPDPEVASDCVPVEPTGNGNVCEPKRYVADTQDTLKLQVASDCNMPSEEEDAATYITGSVPFPAWGGRRKKAKKCIDALFPYAFEGDDSTVKVLATVSHPSARKSGVHDPTSVWIEDITTQGFTACVQETKRNALNGRADRHDDRAVVDYIAYKELPFEGARFGSVRLVSGFTGKTCSEMKFSPAFKSGSQPKIVATANHRTSRDRHVVNTVWFEDVTADSAKACVSVPKKSDPEDSSTELSYLAWNGLPTNLDQGVVAFDAFNWRNHRQASACKVVDFDKAWIYAPQIQISLNHRGYDGTTPHEAMTAWVEFVNKDAFKVCAEQLGDTWKRKGDHEAFKIDWFATGFQACPSGELLRPGTTVSYYYLKKDLTAMPDLTGLTPNHVITVDGIDDDKRGDFEKILPDFPEQNVAGVWQGVLVVAEPGMYSFFANAVGDIRMWIDGVSVIDGMELVNKRRRRHSKGRVRLSAGVHGFKANWFVGKTKTEKLRLKWSGKQTGFKRVPFVGSHCTADTPTDPVVGLQPGFEGKWYFFNRDVKHMPDVTIRVPDHTGVSQALDYRGIDSLRKDVPSLPEDHFAAVFTGVFLIRREGNYVFSSQSDDGKE